MQHVFICEKCETQMFIGEREKFRTPRRDAKCPFCGGVRFREEIW